MESIGLLRVIIDIVVKDVSVKEMIMKRSDGDKNENEDENEWNSVKLRQWKILAL